MINVELTLSTEPHLDQPRRLPETEVSRLRARIYRQQVNQRRTSRN